MTFLLLFSALLSAITGTSDTVGRLAAPQVISRGVAVASPAARAVESRAARPVSALPSMKQLAGAGTVMPIAIGSGAPIYASRRRE